MKMIKAIIRPERLEFVKKALENNGIFGMTVMAVEGRGDQKGISLQYRGGAINVDMIPKIQMETERSWKRFPSVGASSIPPGVGWMVPGPR